MGNAPAGQLAWLSRLRAICAGPRGGSEPEAVVSLFAIQDALEFESQFSRILLRPSSFPNWNSPSADDKLL